MKCARCGVRVNTELDAERGHHFYLTDCVLALKARLADLETLLLDHPGGPIVARPPQDFVVKDYV
jgi:hypothetical protein